MCIVCLTSVKSSTILGAYIMPSRSEREPSSLGLPDKSQQAGRRKRRQQREPEFVPNPYEYVESLDPGILEVLHNISHGNIITERTWIKYARQSRVFREALTMPPRGLATLGAPTSPPRTEPYLGPTKGNFLKDPRNSVPSELPVSENSENSDGTPGSDNT